jgi:hypothetical protein
MKDILINLIHKNIIKLLPIIINVSVDLAITHYSNLILVSKHQRCQRVKSIVRCYRLTIQNSNRPKGCYFEWIFRSENIITRTVKL